MTNMKELSVETREEARRLAKTIFKMMRLKDGSYARQLFLAGVITGLDFKVDVDNLESREQIFPDLDLYQANK